MKSWSQVHKHLKIVFLNDQIWSFYRHAAQIFPKLFVRFVLMQLAVARGNNPQHSTKTERGRGRRSPQAKLTQTDNFKVKTVVYLAKGREGGRRGGEKIYLICNCQESIFTCKIASEWERLPWGRNMTAFTRVRMDHHLQPPPPDSLFPSIALTSSLRSPSLFLPFSLPHPVFRLHHSALRQTGSLDPD